MFERQRSYPVGSVVQHRNHYIHIKTRDGEWQSQHRWIAAQKGDVRGKSGDLKEGEKVFHLNGRKDDNNPRNLIRIQFDTTKYYLKPLQHGRVLHIPSIGRRMASRA